MKYQFVVFLLNNPNKNSASSKALSDGEKILLKNGYQSLNIYLAKSFLNLFTNLIKFLFHLIKLVAFVKKGSTIVVQYPLLGFNNYMKWLIKLLKKRAVKFICIVHDTESLRRGQPELYQQEIINLNCYDVVIAHNMFMIEWLKSNGLKSPCVSLTLFDYLLDHKSNSNQVETNSDLQQKSVANTYSVAFAGNLEKSGFVSKLSSINSIRFNLYGSGLTNTTFLKESNTVWKGSFSPDKISGMLEGNFGLLWDGNSLTECTGAFGHYLQFNNPHKLSLYISAGLPVIVPVKSAVAKFVKEQHIGICIDSLLDIEHLLKSISKEELIQYQTNVLKVRAKIINGLYLSTAIKEAESVLSSKSY